MSKSEGKKKDENVEISTLEVWNKTFNSLKTMKMFFPKLEENRYKIALKPKMLKELLAEKKAEIDVSPKFKANKEIQMKIKLYYGNITKINPDIIVNSANPMMTSGGGVMGAVWQAGGSGLQNELEQVMKERENDPFNVTDYIVTENYNLKCKKIIHVVPPNCKIDGGYTKKKEKELEKCYENCLKELKNKDEKMKSIGLVALSTGKFAFPLIRSVHVACKVVRKWMEVEENRKNVDTIIFVVRSADLHSIYEHLMCLYFPG